MKVTVEKLPKSQVKLIVEVPQERLEQFQQKAAEEISKNLKIPGFRPGKAPLDVVKQQISEDTLMSFTIDKAVPDTYTEAVFEQKLQVVSKPKVNITKIDPLTYEATVAIYPEVKVEGYDKAKIKKEEVKVEEKDIDAQLAEVQKRRATYKEVDRASKMGDRVEVDFEGFDEGGATLDNTKSSNHPVVLGDKNMIPGFEEELVGLKKGERKDFWITFPKEYFHKPFQGKKVQFKTEVKMVEERSMPEWTPEFIKEVTGGERSMEEVRKDLKEALREEKVHAERVRQENEFLDLVVKKAQVEIPDILVEEELDSIMEEFKNELQNMRVNYEDYLKANNKDEKALRDERKAEAEKRLTLRFGLQQIFTQEKIEVTAEDMKKEIDHMVGLYPEAEQNKVREQVGEGSYMYRRMENKLRIEKLFDKYLDK